MNQLSVRMAVATPLYIGLFCGLLTGCSEEKKGPVYKYKEPATKVSLPSVPAFDLPSPGADGSLLPRLLRVNGRKYLDQEVKVRGYVTWAYDCLTDVTQPGMTPADAQKLIDEDPSRCDRPQFYLGDTAATAGDRSIWVVGVPRAVREDEKKVLEPADIKAKNAMVPPYKVGDEMIITGTWAISAPSGQGSSDGLLVYKEAQNVTQSWTSPPPVIAPAAP